MFYVVSYDISDDKRRDRVHDLLMGYGEWVQYSVFECNLVGVQFQKLRERLEALIEPEKDSLRYYRVCHDCLNRTVVVGKRPLSTDPDYWLI